MSWQATSKVTTLRWGNPRDVKIQHSKDNPKVRLNLGPNSHVTMTKSQVRQLAYYLLAAAETTTDQEVEETC